LARGKVQGGKQLQCCTGGSFAVAVSHGIDLCVAIIDFNL